MLAGPLPAIRFMEISRSKPMATPHLIAPARLGSMPTPCGIRPTRPPASRVSSALDFWPFSAFARAARLNPLHWRITPARLGAWILILKKVLGMTSQSNVKITAGNNGEQSCRKGKAGAFRNIMELAHNICLSHLERIRNLKDKIKDFANPSTYMDFGSFLVRKYYLIGPA